FEVLRRVRRLHCAARRGRRFEFKQLRPQFCVFTQSVHHGRVAFGSFGMTGACVVLLKDWMMHERGLHARDYAWRARARSNMPVVSMKSIRTRVCLVRSHC